jgi:repressor LexA
MAKLDTVPDDFRDNLRTWRHVQGLSQRQAADILRCERSYLSQLENGRKPGKGVLIRFLREWELFKRRQDQVLPGSLASASGPVPLAGRMMTNVLSFPDGAGLRRLPLVSWDQAREADTVESIATRCEETIPSDLRDESAFAVRLRGDSMEPRFEDGDVMVVSTAIPPSNGDIVLGNLKDQGMCCKIMHVHHDKNLVTLTCYNPAYPPMQHNREDFNWIFPVAQVVKYLRRA